MYNKEDSPCLVSSEAIQVGYRNRLSISGI